MRLPITWLKEFVTIPWPAKELAHRLTMAGLETAAAGPDLLEVSVTPNRGDCLSVLGAAREISTLQGRPLAGRKTSPPPGTEPIRQSLSVQVLDRKGCPRYMARLVRGVSIQPSPAWLQKRLEEVGIRPINNVVDCTNYVMIERGQPLHAFDFRRLKAGKIIVRREKSQTRFTTLDGQTQVCEPADLFICDGEGPVALAGIMGGANSEVSPGTQDIVLEAAFFDPERIHATAKRLNLSTESSCRFERGVDPNGTAEALHRVCELIVETAGGQPSRDWIDVYPKKIGPGRLNVSPAEVERMLGVKIPSSRIQKILRSLGLEGKIPTWRFDLSRPIDLVEEVARIYGYENIPPHRPRITVGFQEKPKGREVYRAVVECLTGLGFSQGCHLRFESAQEAGPEGAALDNPLSADQTCLRRSLSSGLLKAAQLNANAQIKDLKLFEWGKVFRSDGGKVVEEEHLGLAAFGSQWPAQWHLPSKAFDFFGMKGVLETLFETLRFGPLTFQGESQTRTRVCWEGDPVGSIELFNMEVLVYVCELNLQKIIEKYKTKTITFKPIVKFPFVERDVALVVDELLPAQKIEEAIWASKTPWIRSVKLFDLYRGEGLEPGKKSLAFGLVYSSAERTLTNEEVNRAHETLTRHLEATLPARLR